MIQRLRFPASSGFGQLTLLRPRIASEIDAYDLLVEAICHQASKDIRGKDTYQRFDAMDFFRSEWFRALTRDELDGEEIINKLLDG